MLNLCSLPFKKEVVRRSLPEPTPDGNPGLATSLDQARTEV